MKMICPRDFTLRSKTGATISFEAGVPTNVPEDIVPDALAVNIVPADGVALDGENPVGYAVAQITGTLRDALILNAIQTLVQRNAPEDFDGGGQPKTVSLSALAGLTVAASERTKYWNRYREIIGSNSEMPTHPNVGAVLDLQSMSTRKQLKEFAADHGMEKEFEKFSTKSLPELKTLLLGNLVGRRQGPMVKTSTLVED
jgi:hypothetical protein